MDFYYIRFNIIEFDWLITHILEWRIGEIAVELLHMSVCIPQKV